MTLEQLREAAKHAAILDYVNAVRDARARGLHGVRNGKGELSVQIGMLACKVDGEALDRVLGALQEHASARLAALGVDTTPASPGT